MENPASLGSNGVGKGPMCENVNRIYLKTNLKCDCIIGVTKTNVRDCTEVGFINHDPD